VFRSETLQLHCGHTYGGTWKNVTNDISLIQMAKYKPSQ